MASCSYFSDSRSLTSLVGRIILKSQTSMCVSVLLSFYVQFLYPSQKKGVLYSLKCSASSPFHYLRTDHCLHDKDLFVEWYKVTFSSSYKCFFFFQKTSSSLSTYTVCVCSKLIEKSIQDNVFWKKASDVLSEKISCQADLVIYLEGPRFGVASYKVLKMTFWSIIVIH